MFIALPHHNQTKEKIKRWKKRPKIKKKKFFLKKENEGKKEKEGKKGEERSKVPGMVSAISGRESSE